MNRPYRKIFLKELKEFANKNWNSLPELKKILSEIELRQDRDVNLEFECEIGERIEYLTKQEIKQKKAEELEAKRLAKYEGIFKWPTTDAPASKHGFKGNMFWYKDGLLSFVGYKVGYSGETKKIRQNILDCVFFNELPNVKTREYMQEWGERKTPKRLNKMAESIAAFTRNAKRHCADYDVAIKDWEEDLDYLYKEYYIGEFGFNWPIEDI